MERCPVEARAEPAGLMSQAAGPEPRARFATRPRQRAAGKRALWGGTHTARRRNGEMSLVAAGGRKRVRQCRRLRSDPMLALAMAPLGSGPGTAGHVAGR